MTLVVTNTIVRNRRYYYFKTIIAIALTRIIIIMVTLSRSRHWTISLYFSSFS